MSELDCCANPKLVELRRLGGSPRKGIATAERELGWTPGDPINIGWYCSDRICELGHGREARADLGRLRGDARTYTFDDLRVLQHRGAFLSGARPRAGRARLPLHGPRAGALHLVPRILKMGAIAQPLFSAFGDESLWTRLVERRDRGDPDAAQAPPEGAQDPREAARPAPRHRRRCGGRPLQEREVALTLDELPRVERASVPVHGRDAVGAALHLGTTGQPKGAQHVHYSLDLAVPDREVGARPAPDDVYWCNADPGWVTGTSYGIIGPWALGVTQVVLDAGFNAERWYSVHREAPRHRLVLGADGDPPADEGRGRRGARARPLLAAAPAASASRSTPRRDLVEARRSACRSTTPSGRPRPAAS
jgi:acetyl-CoA synthetase